MFSYCIKLCCQADSKSDLHTCNIQVAESIGKTISAITERRRLHINGLCNRVPRVCVLLSIQPRGVRLKQCRQHINLPASDWGNVMSTDESRYALKPDDWYVKVWRKVGTCNRHQNTAEHDAFLCGSIMVCIDRYFVGILHRFAHLQMAVQHRDEVLDPIVRLHTAAFVPAFVLTDDIYVPLELASSKTTKK